MIRHAKPQDAAAIADIGRRSFVWAFGDLFTEDVLSRYLQRTYAEDKISESLQKTKNIYFVAETDGRVAGFLKLKTALPHKLVADPNAWQLQKLYVDPEQVAGGIGKQLMLAGEQEMQRQAVETAWLLVYEGNARAQKFYLRHQYVNAGKQQIDFEYIRIGFDVYSKALTSRDDA